MNEIKWYELTTKELDLLKTLIRHTAINFDSLDSTPVSFLRRMGLIKGVGRVDIDYSITDSGRAIVEDYYQFMHSVSESRTVLENVYPDEYKAVT